MSYNIFGLGNNVLFLKTVGRTVRLSKNIDFFVVVGYLCQCPAYCHVKPKPNPLPSKLFKILTIITISDNTEGKRLFAHAHDTIKTYLLFEG